MAGFLPSATGYASVTLTAPPPSVRYTQSQTGYALVALTNPVPNLVSSQTGYTSVTLTAPTPPPPPYTRSLTGFVVVALAPTHKPFLVMTAPGVLKRARLRTWDGTALR